MSGARSYVERYAGNLRARIASLEDAGNGETVPNGSLRVVRSGKYISFHVREYRDGRQITRYVPRSEEGLLRGLARKRYNRAVLPKLKDNLRAAEAFLARHSGEEEEQAACAFRRHLLFN